MVRLWILRRWNGTQKNFAASGLMGNEKKRHAIAWRFF
jgi:hypothetical protein